MTTYDREHAGPPSSASLVTSATSATSAREVRLERWEEPRAFHVVSCSFRVDLPLDMSGCIVAALSDARRSGHRRRSGGLILASDRWGGHRGGAIFVEVEPIGDEGTIALLEGDHLVRSLPTRAHRLRSEVDELVRWSSELGQEVESFYVGFVAAEAPGAFRPTRLFASLEAVVVETFEIGRTRRHFDQTAHA